MAVSVDPIKAGLAGDGVASGSADSGAPVKVGAKYNQTPPTFTDGQRADLQADSAGSLRVTLGGAGAQAGADAVGNTASARLFNGGATQLQLEVRPYQFNGTSFDRTTKANATGRLVSAAASTNETVVKASAGTIHAIDGYNAASTVRYLKIYNKATAPTVGTDTPVRTIALKPTDRFAITFPLGYYCATGISFALTTGAADADTGALTLADVVGLNVDYS